MEHLNSESADAGAGAQPAAPPRVASVLIQADPTVSYASYQNAIPLVRLVEISNGTDSALVQVSVQLSVEPEFAEPITFRFERLEPGEVRRIRTVDLKFKHRFLSELTEAVRGRVEVKVLVGDVEVAEAAAPVECLSYEQWGGTRGIPELLAAFCMPNHPTIERLIFEAGELLQRSGRGVVLNGYESKNREHVWAIISAVYSAISAHNVHYSLPPASFATSGQKIRTPDRIFEGGVATCLDFTMLLASGLEQAGLNPIVLLQDGHSWLGVWLVNTTFPTALVDDAQAVRKRIDAGEMIAIETTGMGNRPTASLKSACETGLKLLRDEADKFKMAIDVRRTRIERIQPLPSRQVTTAEERPMAELQPAVEAPPALPPFAGEAVLLDEQGPPDTPEGRLERWRSRLLDLTLRNRLLNFKPSKAHIPLVVPDVAHLEDQIAAGAEWSFRPRAKIMEAADPRSEEVTERRQGTNPLVEMARAAMADHEILVALDRKGLDDRLYEVYLTVKNNQEEGGANTLFLAVGFLKWVEDESAEKVNSAPLLLIPVRLQRRSVRTGFYITRHDDETLVNPTLLQMLRERFEIDIKGLDPLPRDESGVDVTKILAIFRQAVKEVHRWEVSDDVYLGIFSFAKYLLWKDLKDRTADLKANRLVGHLIDRPREPLNEVADLRARHGLDERHQPEELLAPLLADSSQLNALSRALEGHSLIVEGPPGTGKSQTITNLLVAAMARGMTCLFVSEKITALGVVEKRLKDLGLGAFCLQVHSAKSTKSEVLEQLRQARDVASPGTSATWMYEAQRLGRLRRELNTFVRALHRVHKNGMTVRGATDIAIDGEGWPAVSIEQPGVDAFDSKQLGDMRDLVAGIQAVLGELGDLARHPLAVIRQSDWSNGWEDKLMSAVSALDAAAIALEQAAASLAPPLGLPLDNASVSLISNTDALCDVLLRAAEVPTTLAAEAGDAKVRMRLERMRTHGQKRNEAWAPLAPVMRPNFTKLKGEDLERQWMIASAKWWLPRALDRRAIATQLLPYTANGKRPAAEQIPELIERLNKVNVEDDVLQELAAEGQRLLEDRYSGLETDWNKVQSFEVWAAAFETAIGRFASVEDPEMRTHLADRMRMLISTGGALLRPGGALAARLVEYRRRVLDFNQALSATEKLVAVDSLFADSHLALGAITRLRAKLQGWTHARRHLRLWCRWQVLRVQAQAVGLARVIESIEAGAVQAAEFARYAEYCYAVWWLRGVVDEDSVLRDFSSVEHMLKIKQFREADERFQNLTKDYVFAKLAAGVPEAGQERKNSEMGVLNHELQKQRAHLAIRRLFQSIPNLLTRLKPCLMMSPLSVAQYLDAAHPKFDLVVFDEASQLRVWDAVGAIARGKQSVIAGDTKQLPPPSFFERTDGSDAGDDVSEDAPPQDLDSILEECMGVGMAQVSLEFHYRSRSESLIDFSNKRYYDSRLITFPAPEVKDDAVKLIPVGGIYDRGATRTNRAEADRIAARVVNHYMQDDPEQRKATMCVITLNQPQMRLIDQLIQQAMIENPMLEERMKEHGSESWFCKNLENAQGEERDYVLFSVTYGRDQAGRMPMNFGPINQEGGHRRLNVAVTRARAGVEVYSSIRADEIDLAKTRSRGVADLKAYLDYAARGAKALVEESLPTGREPDSPFEREVIKVLRQANWQVHPQVGCSGFRIDMAVVDRNQPGRYLVGIECDGATYHSQATARDRDRLRQAILEGLGWRLHRIWSTDWWTNRAATAERVLGVVHRMQVEADASRAR